MAFLAEKCTSTRRMYVCVYSKIDLFGLFFMSFVLVFFCFSCSFVAACCLWFSHFHSILMFSSFYFFFIFHRFFPSLFSQPFFFLFINHVFLCGFAIFFDLFSRLFIAPCEALFVRDEIDVVIKTLLS